MVKKTVIFLAAVIAAALVIPYLWIGMGDKPFDDEARALAPGQFAELTSGKLHYVWVEPAPEAANGETIVMLHGLYIPHFMFAQNAEALSAAGYRVLLPDLFGHGFSDRPTEKYDQAFFERQLRELLDATGVDKPFYLAGQSTGAMAATLYASQHPDQIKGLMLIVPAGLRMHGPDDDLISNILRTPIAGDWLWRIVGRRNLLAPWKPPCDVCGDGPLLGDPYIQTEYRGYFPAMLNILRHFPLRDQDDVFKAAGDAGFPMLAIFGGKDETVHIDSAAAFATAAPNAELVIIENGDHAMNFRKSEAVNPVLLSFLAGLNPALPADEVSISEETASE
jgi:pimeloyl-ACP methyl ester carboxylesterase